MKESKKVVLFLVEGVTDETALGLSLSKIIEQKNIVRFKIIGGDITTHIGTNPQNCINRVVAQVKEFLEQDFYQKGDLIEIIHLVDLDGVFIPEESVICDKTQLPKGSHIYYTDENIVTDHVEQIKERNHQKVAVLEKLVQQKEIYGKIPYELYYFSCNLEHVFYNEANASRENKYEMAKNIVDQYVNEPEQLIEFMNSEGLVLSKEYMVSWTEIKNGVESLNRHSNFNLFLNKYHNSCQN